MYKKVVYSFSCLLIALASHGQEINIRGYFLEDSIKIGLGSPYVLAVDYPRSLDVLFPDSLHDYSPYELGKKLFFPTRSDSSRSYDSAVYYLTSFEIDSIQYFQLPIYQLTGNDSVKIMAAQDSVILQHMVREIPDAGAEETIPLRENTAYRYVQLALNYPYLIVGIILFIVLAVVAYLVFGQSIKKWFKLKRLKKRHEQYLEKYLPLQSSSEKNVEPLLLTWKAYLEQLEKIPFTKMTTKELVLLGFVERVEDELRAIDRMIYGKKQEDIESVFTNLLRFAENRYADKVNEIKYG